MKTDEAGVVLIVDDNPRNLDVLSDTLTNAGFRVAVAVSGARAIQLAKEGSPDLILLDVKMEGLDGFETCRRLKMDPSTSDIPIIFITASTDLTDRVKGLSVGAVDYLSKPFHDAELLARVQVHTKLRSTMKQLGLQIEERLAAERALQTLTRELETRVAQRTVELAKAVDGLKQAEAQRATVIRAAQAVAGEIILDRVLDRLMRIALEHTSGQKCVLVLSRESGLVVAADLTRESDTARLGLSTPVEQSGEIAVTVVREVAASSELVFISDTSEDPGFAATRTLGSTPAKSILCLPMIHQGDLTGVLYLESDAARQAPTPTQLETLGLLASQAAVAVNNALLYARVADATSSLRVWNDALGTEIALRTDELRQANERLTLELAERQRSEEARAALQQQIILAQNARLAELSTPLIPITDHIMVMPLIGTIDAARAEQALEVALHGAQAHRAMVIILDVTGVTVLDSAVAGTLMRTAAALRLLGAQTIVTGIRAELAQTLIALDVDMSAVVTKASLKSGIAYALMQVGGDTATKLAAHRQIAAPIE